MKIQFHTYSIGNINKQQNSTNNINKSFALQPNFNDNKPDFFMKSVDGISFSGVEKKNNKKDILSDLEAIGIVGAPFVLSIGAGTYVMNRMNPKDIFLPDGTYFMSTDQLKTDAITVDSDEGILK